MSIIGDFSELNYKLSWAIGRLFIKFCLNSTKSEYE